MCSNGDFTVASGGDGHQTLGAIVVNPKTSRCIFGKIFSFFHFFSFMRLLTTSGFRNLAKFHKKKDIATNLLSACTC